MDNIFLNTTALLDYDCDAIQFIINQRKWRSLAEFERIKSIYNFVRDEVLFGFNESDSIKASRVLIDGYGQCNTKASLLMALLRGCGVPCRIHGYAVDKQLQKGIMTGFVYRNAPDSIIHSSVEVYLENVWYELEGYIIDKVYLSKLQKKTVSTSGRFMGYGIAVRDFENPIIDFNRNNTFIQSEGIIHDYGVFSSPDIFFNEYRQKVSGLKMFIYKYFGRHLVNLNVKKIRMANI